MHALHFSDSPPITVLPCFWSGPPWIAKLVTAFCAVSRLFDCFSSASLTGYKRTDHTSVSDSIVRKNIPHVSGICSVSSVAFTRAAQSISDMPRDVHLTRGTYCRLHHVVERWRLESCRLAVRVTRVEHDRKVLTCRRAHITVVSSQLWRRISLLYKYQRRRFVVLASTES